MDSRNLFLCCLTHHAGALRGFVILEQQFGELFHQLLFLLPPSSIAAGHVDDIERVEAAGSGALMLATEILDRVQTEFGANVHREAERDVAIDDGLARRQSSTIFRWVSFMPIFRLPAPCLRQKTNSLVCSRRRHRIIADQNGVDLASQLRRC
jgi:hypothetical protein